MATQPSRLNPQFCVTELRASEADAAFPLVSVIAPDKSRDEWREYVLRRSMQGGLLGLYGADGSLVGLSSYRFAERLRHGRVLALDDFVTFELSLEAPGRGALIRAAEKLARSLGCTGLEVRIDARGFVDAGSGKAHGWLALGLTPNSVVFVKSLIS